MRDINVTTEKGTSILEIREGQALEIKPPKRISITGILNTPLRWLEKRLNAISVKDAHIIVDRSQRTIKLVLNETDEYKYSEITGSLTVHPIFERFGINSGIYKTPLEISELIKMNRTYFENTQQAMELVSELKNFKAKINKKVEQEFNLNKGDKRILQNQVIESNIPTSFKVELPIFKGGKKHVLEVETYFNPDDLTCTLVSSQANDIIEQATDQSIDEIIEKIKALTIDIPMIEV